MKLLLIEDDLAFAQTLARRMQKHGFETLHLSDLHDVIAKSQGFAPQYILLDMKLADESSINYIPPLRQHFPTARIIMLTGYASIATAVAAIKLGADDYLTKPASSQLIIQTLLGEDNMVVDNETVMSPDRLEWEHIQQVLKANHGNISQTARALNMHRRTLQRKLQKKPVYQ
ncbi:response regulator transcription factor [Pseudoalteromonas 'SMAR']|uniref:response regulator transcription factor n=1 Tax=Pseudoalteromonas 'SMAR' TaxID=3416908 RepID=UPI003AF28847